MTVADKQIFGVPVVMKNSQDGTEASAYVLFDTSEGVIKPIGTYNHDISYIGDAAVRGTCIKNILYTVSGEKVVAFLIGDKTDGENRLKEISLNKPETTDGQGK